MAANTFTDALVLNILDHIFGKTTYTPPDTVYVALLTEAAGEGATGDNIAAKEATYTGYARKAVPNDTDNWNTAVAGVKTNKTNIEFAKCTAGSSTITHFAICETAGSGLVLGSGQLTVQKLIQSNDIPIWTAGDIIITLD